MITDFLNSANKPDYDSLLEQCSLIVALGNNQRNIAQEIIDNIGGGTIDYWTWNNDELPPSYFIWHQGNDYSIVFDGSSNWLQIYKLAQNSLIDFAVEGYPLVNSFAAWLESEQRINIRSRLPINLSGKTLHVSGHSLGAWMSWLTSLRYVPIMGTTGVQLMTLGMPKLWSANPGNLRPQKLCAAFNQGDPAPYLPPYGVAIMLPATQNDYISSDSIFWQHYNQVFQIAHPAGNLIERDPTYFNFFRTSSFIDPTFASHNMKDYLKWILVGWKANVNSGQNLPNVPIAEVLAASPEVQTTTAEFDPADYINYGEANSLFESVNPNAPLNLGNITRTAYVGGTINGVERRLNTNIYQQSEINMVASGKWKITMAINNTKYGRLESHVYNGTTNLTDAFNKASALAAERADLLGCKLPSTRAKKLTTPCVEFFRISDALNPRISQLYTFADGGFFPNISTNSSPDFFATAISIRMRGLNTVDNTTISYANWLCVAQPDSVCEDEVYNGTVILGGKSFDTQLSEWLNYLSSPANNLGYMGIDTTQTLKICSGFAVNANNQIQFTCTGHGYNDGDKVRLQSADALHWDGTWTIGVINANALVLLKPAPNMGNPLPNFAKVRRIQANTGARFLQFYQYQTPVGGWVTPYNLKISKKNPAREVSTVSFRRRGSR